MGAASFPLTHRLPFAHDSRFRALVVGEADTPHPIDSRDPALRSPRTRDEAASWFHGVSRHGAFVVAAGLMLCVAVGDDLTGSEVSFTLLYLGPIGFATWFAGPGFGLVLSVASAITGLVSDGASRNEPLPLAIQIWNLSVQLGVFVSLAFLLGALKSRLEGEHQLARTDPLTRLSNRRSFLEAAGIELERARRTGKPITVAYVDCDDFKRVNDVLGHAEGDALLQVVAGTLRGETRAIDAVSRLGGDEFGLLLVDSDRPTAEEILERLRGALLEEMREHGWKVTFSIGAVTFIVPPLSIEEMIHRADELMYATKRRGKNGLSHAVVDDRKPHVVRGEQTASA